MKYVISITFLVLIRYIGKFCLVKKEIVFKSISISDNFF
jgi:hypothetical protein